MSVHVHVMFRVLLLPLDAFEYISRLLYVSIEVLYFVDLKLYTNVKLYYFYSWFFLSTPVGSYVVVFFLTTCCTYSICKIHVWLFYCYMLQTLSYLTHRDKLYIMVVKQPRGYLRHIKLILGNLLL